MEKIELFVQGEGAKDIAIIEVHGSMTVEEIIILAQLKRGVNCEESGEVIIFFEDHDVALDHGKSVDEVQIKHRDHIHLHRCQKIEVTVNFNASSVERSFPPSTTLKNVKKWATGHQGFNLSELDASEHALQVCGTAERPDEDTHLGTLAAFPNCKVAFDLVPKKRVEG